MSRSASVVSRASPRCLSSSKFLTPLSSRRRRSHNDSGEPFHEFQLRTGQRPLGNLAGYHPNVDSFSELNATALTMICELLSGKAGESSAETLRRQKQRLGGYSFARSPLRYL